MGKPEIYKRDDGICFYCHKKLTEEEASLEHLLSTVHGGNNDKHNLTIACKECNGEVGAKAIVKKIAYRDEKLEKAWGKPRRLDDIKDIKLKTFNNPSLTDKQKALLTDAVKKIVDEYGETLRLLSDA